MTADQPLSENSIARGAVGGGLIVIRYSNTYIKSFRTTSLNSEGMLRGTDNFYFILITFSFKLELVLINRVINIFLTGVPIRPFCLSSVVCNKVSHTPEPFIYAPLHGMKTILTMLVLSHFCYSQECMQNDRDLIHLANTFF